MRVTIAVAAPLITLCFFLHLSVLQRLARPIFNWEAVHGPFLFLDRGLHYVGLGGIVPSVGVRILAGI